MDGGAVAGATVARGRDAGVGMVRIERALFTSIRSPMGAGYRIVAASPGISPSEKRAIIRGAPAHGSLCDPSPGETALAGFVLDSARRCIFLSSNRGTEHTARGGCRVHTHVLIMDPQAFRRFHCDPFEVEAAALPQLGDTQEAAPSPRIEPLALRWSSDGPASSGSGVRSAVSVAEADARPTQDDCARLDLVLAVVLEKLARGASGDAPAGLSAGRSLLLVGSPRPRQILRWVLDATPAAMRERLSLSCGLRFSPTRRFEFVLTHASSNELGRIARDRELDVLHWDSLPAPARRPFDGWLRFVRQAWESGRAGEVARLSAELTADCTSIVLEQIARISEDLERVRVADPPLLRELMHAYQDVAPATAVQKRLLDEFRVVARQRQIAFEEDQ